MTEQLKTESFLSPLGSGVRIIRSTRMNGTRFRLSDDAVSTLTRRLHAQKSRWVNEMGLPTPEALSVLRSHVWTDPAQEQSNLVWEQALLVLQSKEFTAYPVSSSLYVRSYTLTLQEESRLSGLPNQLPVSLTLASFILIRLSGVTESPLLDP